MLQLDEIKDLDDMMQDAIAFQYITQPLTPQQWASCGSFPARGSSCAPLVAEDKHELTR
jgi:hypothetical protein